jgi:hypothetical protein
VRAGLCPAKALVWGRTMLDTDKVGDGICGLCAVRYMPSDDNTDTAGEYTDIVVIAGEPSSEIVWHPTSDGVAMLCQQREIEPASR